MVVLVVIPLEEILGPTAGIELATEPGCGESEASYYVMDGAGYAVGNLKTLKEMRWLMRVPETLAEASAW